MNKRILILIIGIALLSGFFGSFLFENLYENYLKQFLFQEEIESSETISQENLQAISPDSPASVYAPAVDYEEAIIKAIEKASPAVVSIVVSKYIPIIEQYSYNPFFNLPPEIQQFFGEGMEFYGSRQNGSELKEVGGGSGFIISSDGLIVTNKHVVYDESASYTVLTNNGDKYEAQVLARDPYRDFAVLKISAKNLPVVKLGDSDSVKLGQTAIAIGNALGEFRNTVSAGVISGLSRDIVATSLIGTTENFEGLIQTDTAINEGNSGGPLLNLKGEVIAINVAMVYDAQNIGFAIPINQVRQAIESVKNTGRIITPYLGVRFMVITPDFANKEGLSVEQGVLIRGNETGPAILPDSPAEKAGLLVEDIILEINNEEITKENNLSKIIQKYNVGNTVNLKVLRKGNVINLTATLEERPNDL
ncbi:trypsin-like peptidase domain-containing protein [Candidatus Wolfebacteria bacterium]|nr:trypsin-like peptidase domain-containing protein [Candidatus Wolfebacteria bacterium]